MTRLAEITMPAPAKLNLSLHILGRRDDGYHLIESTVVFTDIGDSITVRTQDTLSLTVEGEFAEPAGAGEGNLVLKAARLLQEASGCTQGAAITLTKNIPVGAGLGGGSADAAAVLFALNGLWHLEFSLDRLIALAPKLGADVAMCLLGKPLVARGIGEALEPLRAALPPLYAVLVHPRTPLLTADVYQQLRHEPLHSSAQAIDFTGAPSFDRFLGVLGQTRNDLQRPAIAVSAVVAEVLLALETLSPQSDFVRMSGSGTCCYALYSTPDEAENAAEKLRADYPGWWVQKAAIRNG